MEASLGSDDSSMSKSGTQRIGWAEHGGEGGGCLRCFLKEDFKKGINVLKLEKKPIRSEGWSMIEKKYNYNDIFWQIQCILDEVNLFYSAKKSVLGALSDTCVVFTQTWLMNWFCDNNLHAERLMRDI